MRKTPYLTSRLRLLGESPCNERSRGCSPSAATTSQQAWDTCPRADWMLWYVEACGVGRSR